MLTDLGLYKTKREQYGKLCHVAHVTDIYINKDLSPPLKYYISTYYTNTYSLFLTLINI